MAEPKQAEGYWLTRFAFLRGLGFIYSLAFFALSRQLGPLIGSNGLLPARLYLDQLRAWSRAAPLAFPTLFWLNCSDAALQGASYLGLGLSLLLLVGVSNAALLFALWLLYMSFVHVGQLFYGYGWEMMLLEAGFLAVFLCPLRGRRPFPKGTPAPKPVIWLVRWMLFRVMFGAGMIKLRGDPCWRDLTCLAYHYETQPIPNPLSWYAHQMPLWFHKLGVLFNHLAELVAPWSLFVPWRRVRHAGGLILVAFQVLLILSGNLSWLNYLTLVLCIPCFDDQALGSVAPRKLLSRLPKDDTSPGWTSHRIAVAALTCVILVLSVNPALNMLSPGQAMNASFDPFDLVNTYGAFGSVGKRRPEVILEGTRDAVPDGTAHWTEYEFKCAPGDVRRRPCVMSPYHYRLDWQIWFAAMEDYRQNPWLIHFIYKLLQNDQGALSLLAGNPFPGEPPRFIRAELYEYRFTRWGDKSGAWWQRSRLGAYLPPLSLKDRSLLQFLASNGWPE